MSKRRTKRMKGTGMDREQRAASLNALLPPTADEIIVTPGWWHIDPLPKPKARPVPPKPEPRR